MTTQDGNLNNPAEGSEGVSDGSSGNSDAGTLKELLNRLSVLEAHQKTAQSEKDRGVNAVRQDNEQLRSEFADIKSYLDKYPDPADAERMFQVDQMLKANATQEGTDNQGTGSQSNPQAEGQAGGAEQVKGILDKLGVDQTSADYLALIGAGQTAEQAALTLLAKDVGGTQEGNASGVSGGSSGSNVSPQQDVLKSQYDQELDTLQKANGGYITPDMLYRTKEKYTKLGLEDIGYK